MRTGKNIIIWMLLLVVSFSCTGDETVAPQPVQGDMFQFHVALPEMRIIRTRADITDGMIESMYILVFDQNGSFLSRMEAVRTGLAGDYVVRLAPTDQDLAPEQKKRIIHFVGNYDWAGFSDVRNLGRHENDVIMDLASTNNRTTFWQRMELTDGIKDGIFPSAIELITNKAQISVVDNSGLHPESGNIALTDPVFTLGDYLDCGTVAPFNKINMEFDDNIPVESQYATRQPVKETDFIPVTQNSPSGQVIECYEHVNATSDTPMFIILKAKFNAETDFSYYKIDIVPRGQPTLLNIQRNCRYIVDIQSANAPGSKTLSEAISHPATNNVIYSVMMEKYSSISYGSTALYVETTNKTLVHTGRTFTLGYSYFPDVNGAEDNSTIEVELANDDTEYPVIDTYSYTKTSGNAYIEATTGMRIPPYGYSSATFTVKSNESGILLRRVIRLRLRRPSTFENPRIHPTVIPSTAGQRVTLRFTIPTTIQDTNFPMNVYISTTVLMPELASGFDSGLTLDYTENGRYRYKYVAANPGDHTVYFKTIIQQPPEGKLILESELFEPVEISLGP